MHRRLRVAAGIGLALVAGVDHARADDPPAPSPTQTPRPDPNPRPSPDPSPSPNASPNPSPNPNPSPSPSPNRSPTAAPIATASVGPDGLTDEERAILEQTEVIELWDERPDKPFDRDTEVRLTGAELARRGATDLASALALIPEVTVRDAGRGGFIVDIRGARKGAVRVLIDGVSANDPYYGTFDVSTIPVTDIEQIRLSTSPASPIDGPGGPGGVIEVHTRDAIGDRLVVARLTSDSLPTFGGSATGRTALAEHLSIRLSTSVTWGRREFELPTMSEIGESRRATTGAARVEYRKGDRRIAFDAFIDDRHYVPPPSEDLASAKILVVDRETTGRVQATFDDELGKTQVQARAWTQSLARRSRYFDDPELTILYSGEDLSALRVGGMGLLTRPIGKRWRWVASATVDHERATFDAISTIGSVRSAGDATLVEAAAGVQYERGRVRLESAVGLAAPIGLDADPWPEAKLVARWRPDERIEIIATAARKGRTPSLRDRYNAADGNPDLDPEQVNHGELRVIAKPADGIQLDVAPYWRRATGTIRREPVVGRQENLDQLEIRGLDASARVRLHDRVMVGGSYALTLDRAKLRDAEDWTDDPLESLPDQRGDAWIQGTLPRAITVMARGRYFGESVERMATVPGYALLEASAAATLDDRWLAVVRCDDVLDERPETRDGFYLPGRVFSLVVQGTWD